MTTVGRNGDFNVELPPWRYVGNACILLNCLALFFVLVKDDVLLSKLQKIGGMTKDLFWQVVHPKVEWGYYGIMATLMKKSLLLRLGLAMGTITMLAFVGMFSSVFIAETSEGQASAINQAGTLRMQSYRIANDISNIPLDDISHGRVMQSRLLADEFQVRLLSPRLTGALAKTDSASIHASYQQVTLQWREQIRPALERLFRQLEQDAYQTDAVLSLKAEYLAMVDDFVHHVDIMVNVLEQEVEAQIRLLRLIQVISLFLTTLVVFITMYLMHIDVLGPLRELLNAARGVRQGDFAQHVERHSEDELGQLADAFNLMAEDLSKKYSDLEGMVREKTSDLERSNRSLELLYKTTRHLSEAPITDAIYESLIKDIEGLVGTGHGTICLGETGDSQAFKLASTREPIFNRPDLCNPPNCQACFSGADSHIVSVQRSPQDMLRVFSTPIKDQERQYGVLMLEIPANRELAEWQKRLLEAVASHIAIALNMAQRASQSRMLALLEERSVIARELHDSLAQSLSYLKIQVSRLEATVAQPGNDEKILMVTGELRDGLNRAYRQLRELLTTFRLRMDEAGLNAALQKTVEEFAERSHIAITLDNRLGGCKLSPNSEIHVIQVVREALSNVVRHAHADHAVVYAACNVDGNVTVAIDDNGIGMPSDSDRDHHYGLAIMQERAHGLSGALNVGGSALGGTRIELHFSATGKWNSVDRQRKQPEEGVTHES